MLNCYLLIWLKVRLFQIDGKQLADHLLIKYAQVKHVRYVIQQITMEHTEQEGAILLNYDDYDTITTTTTTSTITTTTYTTTYNNSTALDDEFH